MVAEGTSARRRFKDESALHPYDAQPCGDQYVGAAASPSSTATGPECRTVRPLHDPAI
jgi:hypothetical protein